MKRRPPSATLAASPAAEDPSAFAEDAAPSKSQRKREMHALQALGERIVELPESRFRRLVLPERLHDAATLARRITSREGRRRQLQLIGKLMREVDVEEIRRQVEPDDAELARRTAQMHLAERWRDRLVRAPDEIVAFAAAHPEAAVDADALRRLVQAAGPRTAAERAVPGAAAATPAQIRAFRELYRVLHAALEPARA